MMIIYIHKWDNKVSSFLLINLTNLELSGYFFSMQNIRQFRLSVSSRSIIAAILLHCKWEMKNEKWEMKNEKYTSTSTFFHWVCVWNKNHFSSPRYVWQKKRLLFFLQNLFFLLFQPFCLVKFLSTKNVLQCNSIKYEHHFIFNY